MPIEFACEQCSRTLRVPDGTSGKQSQCPACHRVQRIPERRLSIPCPKCKHLLTCAPELLGTRGQCKQCECIFTISLEHAEQTVTKSIRLVFSCTECHKLFEGREDMRGRKGKCDACQAVFSIALREVETLYAESPAEPATLPEKPAATPTVAPRAPLAKPRVSKVSPSKPKPEKFKLPKSTQPSGLMLSGAAAPQAVVLSPAALQQRTRRHAATAYDPMESPIRFMCEQCHELMEVPGSSAGMDTACPYCQAIQSIPARSHEAEPAALDAFSIAADPLADFGASPAVLQNQWAAQSVARHRSGLSFGNVFQVAFENLFPSSLVTPLLALILLTYAVVGWGLVLLFTFMLRIVTKCSLETALVVYFASFCIFGLVSLAVVAWFSAAVRQTALRAVRKQAFDFAKAFSPGGAYGVSLLVVLIIQLLNLIIRLPQFANYFSPGLFGWWTLVWVLVAVPLAMIAMAFISLASFAAMDGDGAGEAIGTSCRLVAEHFPLMIGIKAIVWMVTIPLAVLTLGFAFILPIYFNAALYHLARKA